MKLFMDVTMMKNTRANRKCYYIKMEEKK